MDRYFTKVNVENGKWKFDYRDKILFVGSCFTENIGQRMERLNFQTLINPFGIVYNPISVSDSLLRLVDRKEYTSADLFELDSLWGSFDFHSRYSASTPEEALLKMNKQVEEGHLFLKGADYVVLTFGTAWVFEEILSKSVVANCHKFPPNSFHRYRLSVEQVVNEITKLLKSLWKFNSNLRFLFTVSPVRHLKDTAHGNQLSKSTLLLAIDRLIEEQGQERCAYFPAYEIVMDELRDYRFYAADLVHLSEVGVDHVWTRFAESLISDESQTIIKKVGKIKQAKEHRPFRKDLPAYQQFLTKNLESISQLIISFPYLNLDAEKAYFEEELNGCNVRLNSDI